MNSSPESIERATGHLDAERAQFQRLRRHADPRQRERIIEAHLPLARHLARRYGGSDEPLEDLFQVACVGLVKAVDRYDPGRGFAFSSFALPTILGELRRHFRDHGWAVRVPRRLQELSLRADRATAVLTAEFGRAPGVAELAARLEVSEEDVLGALEVGCALRAAPLPGERDRDEDDRGGPPAPGAVDDGYRQAEHRASLAPLLGTLSDAERQVLALRFGGDLTQTEIAERVGISQMQVSRLIRRSVERLQAAADPAASAAA